MKEVFLPLGVLDEPESLVNSQRTNCSCHGALLAPRTARGRQNFTNSQHVPRSGTPAALRNPPLAQAGECVATVNGGNNREFELRNSVEVCRVLLTFDRGPR